MKDPIISIDRRSKSWAVFDGTDICGKFERYTDENEAIKEGFKRIAVVTSKQPRIVHPVIKKVGLVGW